MMALVGLCATLLERATPAAESMPLLLERMACGKDFPTWKALTAMTKTGPTGPKGREMWRTISNPRLAEALIAAISGSDEPVDFSIPVVVEFT